MKTNYLFKARWLQGAASANESKKMQGNPRKSLLKEGLSKDESSTRLRVDYVSFTSRLRVWHVLCSRMAAVFLLLLTLSIGNAWGAAGDVIKEFDCNVSATTTYARQTPTCDGITWNVSWGQTSYIGTNKSANYGNLKITNSTDLNAGKAVNASITTATQGYCAIIPQSTMANVGKITISCSALNGSPAVYVVSSTSLSTAYTQITLKTGSGLAAQGATMTTSGLTFEFDKKTSGTYYAIVLYSASWYRLTSTDIQFIEGAAAAASHTLSSAVTPAASGSVSLSATSVAEGSTATATATPAAHYTFTSWSISGTGASLSSTTTNPTTVTMGTANATVTATFTAVPKASITLSEAGSTTTDASTYYVGDSYTLPSSTEASCGTKVLVGWSTVEVAETNTKPTSNFYEKGETVTLAASQTFYAVFATSSGSSWSTATLGSLTGSDIFVIANGNYAIPNDEGTTSAPDATSITVAGGEITSTVTDNLKWNISGNSTDGYTFYPNGSTTTWLYCSTTADSKNNDNIRVGTGARKVWKPNNSGYLVTNDTYTARYLSMYGTTDFRSYVNTDNGVFVPTIYKYSATYSNYSTSCVAPSSFNVTYNANGDGAGNATGTTGSVPTDNTDYSSGATVTVSGQGTLAKEGYNFTGWNTAANGSGTSYEEGATFSITANTTLYAQWSIKKYTVTWHVGETTGTTSNVNHGTLFSAIASDAGQPAHGDGALELCGSTKFIGWVKASGAYTGDGKTVDWYDTYKVSASDEITSNTDYYAMYAEADGDASYQLVTSDLGSDWAGKYLIAYSSTIFADGRTGGESGIGASGASVNPTATYLSGTTVALSWGDTYYVTLEEISSGSNTYLLKTQDGYYNYRTANSNGIHTSNNRSTADDYPLTITYNSSSDIDIAAPAGAQFHYNTAGYFRFYKDAGQENIHLYKRVENLVNYRTGCSITCGRPSSPTSTSVTANSATIGWTGGGNGTLSRYEYAYWVDGDSEPTSGFTSAGTSTSANLTNLYAGVKYNWKVRKVCTGSDGESAWLKSDFTTTEVDLTFSVPTGVDAVDGQKSNVALPSANVPTGCGCWSFAGWTTASYATSSDAPAALFLPGAKARVKANAVLYAVYQKSAYRIISRLADIEEDEYYVFTLNDFGVDGAMTSNASGTYYTSSEEVSIKEDEIGKYIENPSSSAIWQFSGTTSAGLFMNIESRKYIDLSSTSSPVATTTTDNLTITVNDESEKQFDIRSNTTTTNYLQAYSDNQWGVDNDHDGYFSARIFKRAESSYSSAPSCPTYTVTFDKNGGTTHDTKYVTACDGYLSELPTAPAENTLNCATRFVGWSAEELTGAGHDEPEDLFSSVVYSPQITDNTTFYAVFASGALLYNDVLTRETTGISNGSTSYSAWSDKTGASGAVYGGCSAGGNDAIQLRTDNSNSGIVTTTSGGKAKKVTVEWNANTTSGRTIDIYGKNTAYSAASDLYGDDKGTLLGSIEYNTETELTIDGSYAYIGIRSHSGALYLTSVTIQWDDCNYSDYMTYCTNVYNDAMNDHKWSTTGNWSNGHVPTINERATINKPVTVDGTTAKAKNVVLDQSGTPAKTGQLIIDAGKELVVAETVRKTTDGSNYTATGENDIIFNSTSSAGLGALVMGTHDGTNKATVNFYTLSTGKKQQNTSVGQYVGTPFSDDTNIIQNWYNSWVYKIIYNSNVIAWDRVNEGQGMDPFKGYCVFSADAWDSGEGHSYWMQGTLVSSANHTCSGLNWQSGSGTANLNNENLLANSWMAPIKIKAMQTSDFVNANATIYIFNSTSSSAYEDLAGNYDTYTVGTSEAVIPAMQSFSVFTTGSSASVTLDYNKIVYAPAVAGTATPTANYAPRRAGASEDEADKMRLFVRTEDGYGDMLYMWEREDFTDGFENGWDGRKLYGESYAPQLYAITPDGEMAVNCVPSWEGTVLGFKKGTEDNVYTFTFEYEGENTWYLNDLREQTSTLINSESSYMFMASDEDMVARFIISRTPIHSTPTGIEQSAISGQKSAVRKIVIDDHVYIIRNGKMYSAEGVMVR